MELQENEEYRVVRAAAVQSAGRFLRRSESTALAVELIAEAGRNGSELVVFPEGFIPAHPLWFYFHGTTDRAAVDMSTELFENSVTIPGPEIEQLQQAAKAAKVYVVMGVCEKPRVRIGSMYNTQVYIGPNGELLGKHQKIVPTLGERLVHRSGGGDTFGAVGTTFGPMSGLLCGENSNPLAIFGLLADGTRVHTMSWPNHFAKVGQPMPVLSLAVARAFAYQAKCYVVSSAGTISPEIIDRVAKSDEDIEFLSNASNGGGSVIVGPDTGILAGPMPGDEEGILYADLDLSKVIAMKLRHDFAGHYARPDIFDFHINRSPVHEYVSDERMHALERQGKGTAPDAG